MLVDLVILATHGSLEDSDLRKSVHKPKVGIDPGVG